MDESSFYLLPLAVRTWAPCGETPLLRVPLTRDHLSAISGITPEGQLFLQVRKQNYDSEAVLGDLARVAAQATRQAPHHLGWLVYSSQPNYQRLSHERGSQANPIGAARLSMPPTSIQMKASGTIAKPSGVSQCLLPQFRHIVPRTDSGKGAPASQAFPYSGLRAKVGLSVDDRERGAGCISY